MKTILILTVLYLLSSCESISVLKTSNNLRNFTPNNGANLVFSTEESLSGLTICARFSTFQFTTKQDPEQVVLSLDGTILVGSFTMVDTTEWYWVEKIGRNWKTGGSIGYSWLPDGLHFYPVWGMGSMVWNTVCVVINNTATHITTIINSMAVYESNEIKIDLKREEHSLSLLGKLKDDGVYHYPVFGAVADVHIWGRALSESEVGDWEDCKMIGGGDIADWEEIQVDRVGLELITTGKNEVCFIGKKTNIFIVSELKMNFHESLEFCSKMFGSEIAVLSKNETAQEVTKVFRTSDYQKCGTILFSGFTDIETEGVFVNTYTGESIGWNIWREGEPNSWGGEEDCARYDVTEGGSIDVTCEEYYCPVCKAPTPTMFKLSGVCTGSRIDRLYLLQPDRTMLGYTNTIMVWEDRILSIVDTITLDILAYRNNSQEYPLGTHPWYFTKDNCTDQGKQFRMLNLHLAVEQPGHFCCTSGVCIDSELRCDNVEHCKDGSDEEHCDMVRIPPTGYRPDNPPVTQVKFPYIDVETSVTVFDIININEVDSTISILFNVLLVWKDPLLDFKFLKQDKLKNRIKVEESNCIWKPDLQFSLLKKDTLEKLQEQISVEKIGRPILPKNEDFSWSSELYPGEENPLEMEIMYQGVFNCPYSEIRKYPFDESRCKIRIKCIGEGCDRINLNPGELNILPDFFGQYKVLKGNKTVTKIGKYTLTLDIILGRNIGSIFLVTYLPTILMNIINQATVYVGSPGNCEFITTVNVTCMMVLASVYISVSTSLPLTASVKPVDIWLLFNLGYPFMVIIVTIIQQVAIVHQFEKQTTVKVTYFSY